VLAVHPSLPVKSVKELIALAKARPGEINVVSSAVGGSNHLAAAQFAGLAGIKLVLIPYKGSAQAMPELLSGAVHMTFESGLQIMPYAKSGKLRVLAVTTAQPSAQYPDLPTVAAAGVPGYDAAGRNAIWAPANTPSAIVTRLSEEIARLLRRPEVKEKLLSVGSEAVGGSPDELAAAMKSEITQTAKVLKSAGIRAE
jgi:tripartite-type tricarboxylate transporter receptor subunit TctC